MADIEQFRKDALEIINAVIREHNGNCIPSDIRELMKLEEIQIRVVGSYNRKPERACYREITFHEEDDRCILSRPADQVPWYESVLSEMLTEGKITKQEYESAILG